MNAIPRTNPHIIFSSEPIEHFRKNRTENFLTVRDLMDAIRCLNDDFEKVFGSRFQFQFDLLDGHVCVATNFGSLTVYSDADKDDHPKQVQLDMAYVGMIMMSSYVHNRDLGDLPRGVKVLVSSQSMLNGNDE